MVQRLRQQAQSSYGTPQPLFNEFPKPVIATRDPTAADLGYNLGQQWANKTTGNFYALASNAGGVATWTILGSVSSTFTTLTATTFVTATAATSTQLNGNTWSAIGTNAAINLVMTPKGAGGVQISTGALTLTSGNIVVTLGNITATAGNIVSTLGNITATQGNITATAGNIVSTLGNITATNGNISMGTAGNGLQIKEGANARMGQSVLAAGTIIVVNTSVTANTRSFISRELTGGTNGNLSVAMNPGVGFTINSDNAADTSTINWLLIEKL